MPQAAGRRTSRSRRCSRRARKRARTSSPSTVARLVNDLGDEGEGDRAARCSTGWTPSSSAPAVGRAILCWSADAHAPTRRPALDPFRRLVEANLQRPAQRRYATFDDLLAYCALSANPVGGLVLRVVRRGHAASGSHCRTGSAPGCRWSSTGRTSAEDYRRGPRSTCRSEDLDAVRRSREDDLAAASAGRACGTDGVRGRRAPATCWTPGRRLVGRSPAGPGSRSPATSAGGLAAARRARPRRLRRARAQRRRRRRAPCTASAATAACTGGAMNRRPAPTRSARRVTRAGRPATSTTASGCSRAEAQWRCPRSTRWPADRRHRRRRPAPPDEKLRRWPSVRASSTRSTPTARRPGAGRARRRRPALPDPDGRVRRADRRRRDGRRRRALRDLRRAGRLLPLRGRLGRAAVPRRLRRRATAERAEPPPTTLGIALQQTNILRDIREDLEQRPRLPAAGGPGPRSASRSRSDRAPGRRRRLADADPLRGRPRPSAGTTDGLRLLPLLDRRSAACCRGDGRHLPAAARPDRRRPDAGLRRPAVAVRPGRRPRVAARSLAGVGR